MYDAIKSNVGEALYIIDHEFIKGTSQHVCIKLKNSYVTKIRENKKILPRDILPQLKNDFKHQVENFTKKL